MNAITLGETLSKRRRELGWTQQEVAERAQIGRRTLIDLEAGEADIGLRRLLRVAMTLGLELDLRAAANRPSEDQLRQLFADEE